MSGPQATGRPGPDTLDDLAVEQAAAAEDRLRIDQLGLVLPTGPASTGRRAAVRRAARAVGAARTTRRPRRAVARFGEPPAGRRRVAILLATPNDKLASRWGDWHFAGALARALERGGHAAHVLTVEHHSDLRAQAADVHLVVRGLRPVPRRPGTTHVLWIISHPDEVETIECDRADLVLVASEPFAAQLRTRTTTRVEVLLQATDAHRFRPVADHARARHPVVVVAKTRDVPRPIVLDALAAGLRPAIHGTGWEAFVDPALVVRDYVPNEQLPVVYSGAGVVLADHWDTMRAAGFASNRLFDVLACGTPVVSDEVVGLDRIFGDAVPTYRDPRELAEVVRALMADPDATRERTRAARASVLAKHTFDHRATRLVELIDEVRRGRGAGN